MCTEREERDRLLEARARRRLRSPRPMGSLSDTFAAHSGFSSLLSDMEALCVSVAKIEVSDPTYTDNKARFYACGTGHVYRQYTSNGFFAEHRRSASYLEE